MTNELQIEHFNQLMITTKSELMRAYYKAQLDFYKGKEVHQIVHELNKQLKG